MDRRKFIHYSAAGAAIAATANKAISAEHVMMNQGFVNNEISITPQIRKCFKYTNTANKLGLSPIPQKK